MKARAPANRLARDPFRRSNSFPQLQSKSKSKIDEVRRASVAPGPCWRISRWLILPRAACGRPAMRGVGHRELCMLWGKLSRQQGGSRRRAAPPEGATARP